MTVINLAEKRAEKQPHLSGTAFCLLCKHEWTGVWPVGETGLECPACGAMRGRSKFDVSPEKARQVWECKCGEQFFHILDDGTVHCPGCGQQWPVGDFE